MSSSENSSDYTDMTTDESNYEESEDVESEDVESEDSELDDSESDDNESEDSELDDSELDDSESDDSEPEDSELDDSELDDSESDDNETEDSESEDSESEDSESDDNESDDNETDDNETDDNETDDNETDDNETEDSKSNDAELGEDSDPLEEEITVVHEPSANDSFVSKVGSILGEVLLYFKVDGDVVTIKSSTECVYKFGDHTVRVTGDEVTVDWKVSWPSEVFCFEVLRDYLQEFYTSKEDTLSEYAVDENDRDLPVRNRDLSFDQPTPPILQTPEKSWYSEESFESEEESENEVFVPGEDGNEVSVVVDLCRRVSKQEEYIRVLKLKHENLYNAYKKLTDKHLELKNSTGVRIIQLQHMVRDHTEELEDINRKIGYLERSLEDKYRDLSDRFTSMNQSVLDYSDKYRHLVENTPTHSTVRHQLASITEEVIKKVLVEKLNPVIEVAARESAAVCIKDFSLNVFNGIMTSTRERITKIERMLKTFGNITDLHM